MKTLLVLALCLSIHAADVTLTWDANTDPPPTGYGPTGGYKVYWGTQSGVHPLSQNAGLQTTNTVSGLTNGVTYYFVVRAYNSDVESDPSQEVSYRVPLNSPQVPSGLRVVGLTTQITIQWEPVGQPSVAAVVDPKLITLDYSLQDILGGDKTQTKGGE